MTLAQFMLPGESVIYESPGDVYYRRTRHRVLITGERLLLHGVTGVFGPKERVVAEPLADIRHLEYSEAGLLSTRGRLDVRFADETVSLTGEPEMIKGVWLALQQQTRRPPFGAADEEVTLVVPPPPLFDELPHPPAQVEPLPASALTRRPPSAGPSRALVIGALCLSVLVAAGALFLSRRPRPNVTAPEAQPSATDSPAAPTPAPTPVSVRVMDETFTLDEGSHRAVKFTVPAEAGAALLSGGFRVTSGNYIDFYVMGEAQYDRFAKGGPPDVTSAVYREEQWNARVGERLSPGAYYLVFDNYDSGDGAQTVAAEFVLVSEQ